MCSYREVGRVMMSTGLFHSDFGDASIFSEPLAEQEKLRPASAMLGIAPCELLFKMWQQLDNSWAAPTICQQLPCRPQKVVEQSEVECVCP